MNGLYEALTIIFLFFVIVYLGASGTIKSKKVAAVCNFLENISYPAYIIHYPLIYIFTAWVMDGHKTIAEAWPYGMLLLVSALVLAYLAFKLYDVPVRKWLTQKILPAKKVTAQG